MKTFQELREQTQKEASYVANDMEIVRSILNKIESDFDKLSLRKQFEKGWANLQSLAKIAGYGVTKNKQATGRTYRYDLKK